MKRSDDERSAGASTILFGGSFDPPHLGHLLIASEASDLLDGAGVLFVPAYRHSMKPTGPVASGDDRLAMLRSAVAADPRFAVSSTELDRNDVSRTYDTVTDLVARGTLTPRPWLVVGEELVPHLSRWYRGSELPTIVRFLIVRRRVAGGARTDADGTGGVVRTATGDANDLETAKADDAGSPRIASERSPFGAGRGEFRYVENPRFDVSSRDIRARLQDGRTIRYLVPDTVYEYIHRHSLYR